jgi:uncharacterized protein (TIGR02231 family)
MFARPIRLTALALSLIGGAGFAQTSATSRVTDVTLYPDGGEVTRVVTVELAQGVNDIRVTDLPAGIIAETIRILPPEGVALGSSTLHEARLSASEPVLSPEIQAAETAVDAAKTAQVAAQGALDAVQADIAAAEASEAFARAVRLEVAELTAPEIEAMARSVGAEVARAKSAAIAARLKLPPLERALSRANAALARAEAVLAALPRGADSFAALSVQLDAAAAGPVDLIIRHHIGEAGWSPVHDWHLTTGAEPALRLERAALVRQSTGEDWRGVNLTLSTAQPGNQASAYGVWPLLVSVIDPVPPEKMADYAEGDGEAGGTIAPVEEPISVFARSGAPTLQGDIVTYRFDAPANVASGVDNLRLTLDKLTLTPRLVALANPAADRTAFALAEFTNDSGELILPAQGYLYRDGNFMGVEWHDQIAAGDKAEVQFGAIDQLRLTRDMPLRSEGDRGLITSTTERAEAVVMKLENLGGQDWLVRVLASVPYSEQEELVVEWTADPAPSETDVKGQRGVLAWEIPLVGGQSQEIRLNHKLGWPEGKILQ